MYRNFLKRFLDIVLALIGLPFLFLICIILTPLIYLDDRGPIFYNSNRLGKDAKIFKMYKFRTMGVNAPDLRNDDGSTYNAENDPRLTRIGRLLRKTSLDEAPQLLNVIKGNMSVIGPRPDLPEAINLYSAFQIRKLEVRPGISGYNQAYFRNSVSADEKFKNDVFYVNNLSFLLDLQIFFRTITTVFKQDGIFFDVTKGKSIGETNSTLKL